MLVNCFKQTLQGTIFQQTLQQVGKKTFMVKFFKFLTEQLFFQSSTIILIERQFDPQKVAQFKQPFFNLDKTRSCSKSFFAYVTFNRAETSAFSKKNKKRFPRKLNFRNATFQNFQKILGISHFTVSHKVKLKLSTEFERRNSNTAARSKK